MAKTDAEWKAELSAMEFRVLRQKGTEPAGSGEYDKFYPKKGEGYFACKGCGHPLYSAEAKFKSGCGWPAFDKCYASAVKTEVDGSFGMRRIEIMCNQCGGHLGHVFEGEGFTPTNERHCVNSVSVRFVKGGSVDTEEEAVTAKL
uniref:Peptide-methionine (R)-S-oxide reductase n=1 Tax=Coccolithus braarudii TaxID=221442 RepID=A0A7S0LF09_9EUKA|mmetsp:Transcript_35018/g.74713  ORF Transcript_35018/g.74713 Transcript_35018/m.74713 type:complete len:145 (+) Transcript_35018:30-464(+)